MVLAVTVLTSMADADLQEVGVSGTALSQVLRLGALARTAGCGGLVASAKEAGELRRELGEGFAIVTPGVRPAGLGRRRSGPSGDTARRHRRRRELTWWSAVRFIEAPDPAKAAAEIVAEIEAAAHQPILK